MRSSNPEAVLEIDDLRTYFRAAGMVVKAVDGVSFTVRRGETLGIVGESGSGKSVACLSTLGLVPKPPAWHPSGTIRYRGRDLLRLAERDLRRLRGNRLAMIFQDPMTSLNPYLRVSRQLTEVLEVHKSASPAAARRSAIAMLERVGIPDVARRIDQYPHQFSGGMRQRVMIAMALLCEPEVLLADEPTTALDVTIQAQILELIAELRHNFGTAVVLVTHDLGVVAGTTDRVAVMYAGRIIEEGPTAQVFAAPAHPYTRGLLASLPRLAAGAAEPLGAIPGLPPDLGDLPAGCPFHPRCGLVLDRCRGEYPPRVSLAVGHAANCWATEAPP